MSLDETVTLVTISSGGVSAGGVSAGGVSELCAAVVVAQEQAVLRVSTSSASPLAVGSLVGVVRHTGGRAHLALVADSVGDHVSELRLLERRS